MAFAQSAAKLVNWLKRHDSLLFGRQHSNAYLQLNQIDRFGVLNFVGVVNGRNRGVGTRAFNTFSTPIDSMPALWVGRQVMLVRRR